MILETVKSIVRHEERDINIVFISNDELLRNTTSITLTGDQRVDCYKSFTEFASYLRLTKEELKDRFIKAIITKAAKKFYSPKDSNCLYLYSK